MRTVADVFAHPFLLAAALALAACSGGAPGEPVATTSEAASVCPTTVVEGLDVYDGNGAIDWTQVAGSGRAFAFIKATQGNYDKQSTFAANWSGAKAAGVLRSPYHFFDPTISGTTQAQWFLAELTAQGGLQPGDLPPMLDIECPTSSTQSAADPNCEYTGNSGWVASATMAQEIFDWLTTVQQATGRTPIVYSYPDWFSDVGFTDAKLTQYPLFIATYGTCADVPAPWTNMVFWQYSATGTVPGITGNVDLDRFPGTKAGLIAYANGPGADAGADAAASDASGAGDATPPADAGTSSDAGAAPETGSLQSDGSFEPDTGAAAGPAPSGSGGGCGCRIAAPVPGGESAGVLALLALVLLARRRR
jgi:lysozyme